MIEIPDVSDPRTFDAGFPHEVFSHLRREAPVYWHEGDYEGGAGYWVISRYETIKTISRQPMLFSSASGTSLEERAGGFVSMIGMDPPDHRRYRWLVAKGFTPKQISAREPYQREIVNSILDGVMNKGACDFVVDIAAELPLRVIAELLGVPQSACHDIFDWNHEKTGVALEIDGNGVLGVEEHLVILLDGVVHIRLDLGTDGHNPARQGGNFDLVREVNALLGDLAILILADQNTISDGLNRLQC